MESNSEGAADALFLIAQSRERLLAASGISPARHAVFATIMGGFVATPALPVVFRGLGSTLLIVCVVATMQWDRRRTGMFISGYRAGRTRRITIGIMLGTAAIFALSTWLAIHHHSVLGPILLGVLAAALAYAGSVWWCRVFRREMLGQGA